MRDEGPTRQAKACRAYMHAHRSHRTDRTWPFVERFSFLEFSVHCPHLIRNTFEDASTFGQIL